jgi:hypothetical protein
MKQVKGGADSLGNTCSTKTTCTYFDVVWNRYVDAVCQSRLVGNSWECRCGRRSDDPCSDQ